jgi:hypothetical protein
LTINTDLVNKGIIVPLNRMVEAEGPNSLDNILAETEIPLDYDLLSIDIDSYDYQVWKGSTKYKPKVVIIEINSGIKPDDMTHIHKENEKQGSGFGPTLALGIEKGYTLVCHTGNLIFVHNDFVSKIPIDTSRPEKFFITDWLGL